MLTPAERQSIYLAWRGTAPAHHPQETQAPLDTLSPTGQPVPVTPRAAVTPPRPWLTPRRIISGVAALALVGLAVGLGVRLSHDAARGAQTGAVIGSNFRGANFSFDEAQGTHAGLATLVTAPAWTLGEINSAIFLDGVGQYAVTQAPVIDASKSFSATAWVRLNAAGSAGTIVSQDGTTNSAFTLGYVPDNGGAFVFTAGNRTLRSAFAPASQVWYHVGATYDAKAHQGTLYVDGQVSAQGPMGITESGSGPTAIGRALVNSAPTAFWSGRIDEVNVRQKVFTSKEVAASVAQAPVQVPARAPAVPLVVKEPYLSAWSPANELNAVTPMFWSGQNLPMAGLAKIDGTVYRFLGGDSEGGAVQATQLRMEFTPTQSRYVFLAGGVHLYVNFVAPYSPSDLQSMSVPMGMVEVQAVSVDKKQHQVSIYMDVTGQWGAGAANASVTGSHQSLPGGLQAFSVAPVTPQVLQEANEYPLWGEAVFAAVDEGGLQFQGGAQANVRDAFAQNPRLADTMDGALATAVKSTTPSFGFARDFGTVERNLTAVQRFFVGHVRTPAVSSLGAPVQPLWLTHWGTWEAMVGALARDAQSGAVTGRAVAVDEQVSSQSVAAGGARHAALAALAFRQAFGGIEAVGTGADPWFALKEISSDGNMNTVDVIFSMAPILLDQNPEILRYLLTPLLTYAESGHWPQVFPEHDIGASFPNGSGHNDGGGENMPVQASGQMVMLMAAYLQASGNSPTAKAFVHAHYPILKQWSNYLVQHALIPGAQTESPDFQGIIPNSTNLALGGIMGLGAMGKIAAVLGQSGDAATYKQAASAAMPQWQAMGMDPKQQHMDIAYGEHNTWSMLFNAFPNRYLGLNLIPDSLLNTQAQLYLGQVQKYGIPLDNSIETAKLDWATWLAAGLGNKKLQQVVSERSYDFLQATQQRVPMTDRYSPLTAEQQGGYRNRPEAGALFALNVLLQQG